MIPPAGVYSAEAMKANKSVTGTSRGKLRYTTEWEVLPHPEEDQILLLFVFVVFLYYS